MKNKFTPICKRKRIKVGDIFLTSNGQTIVIAYENHNRVLIEFLATGTRKYTSARQLRRGCVRDPLRPSLFGVGYTSKDRYVSHRGYTRAGRKWMRMLARCYQTGHIQPSYIGTTVSPDWHDFSKFKEWYDAQPNNSFNFDLDKDLLSFLRGDTEPARVYSEHNCTLLPSDLNLKLSILQKRLRRVEEARSSSRSHIKLPPGIRYDAKHRSFRISVAGQIGTTCRTLQMALDIYEKKNIKAFIDDLESQNEYLAPIVQEGIGRFKSLRGLSLYA